MLYIVILDDKYLSKCTTVGCASRSFWVRAQLCSMVTWQLYQYDFCRRWEERGGPAMPWADVGRLGDGAVTLVARQQGSQKMTAKEEAGAKIIAVPGQPLHTLYCTSNYIKYFLISWKRRSKTIIIIINIIIYIIISLINYLIIIIQLLWHILYSCTSSYIKERKVSITNLPSSLKFFGNNHTAK